MTVVERDFRLVQFVNSWGFVTVEQIGRWMGVSFQTAARRTAVLVEAGLLKRVLQPLVKVSPIVPTRKGCHVAADDLMPLSGIRLGTFSHDNQMVDVAHLVAKRFGGTVEPARRIRHRQGKETHVPDAILHREGRPPIAVELELSVKSPRRLRAILDAYRANMAYESVWYVTESAEVTRALERALDGDRSYIKIVTIERSNPAAEQSQ